MKPSLLYWLLATLMLSPVNGTAKNVGESCVVGPNGVCVADVDENNRAMTDVVADSFGVTQELLDRASIQHYEKSKIYMTETVYRDGSFISVREKCKNRHSHCTWWARNGECDANPGYMRVDCAPACFSCHHLDRSLRCAYDDSAPKMWHEPGDLNRFFENIVQTQPNVTVHSGPSDIVQRLSLATATSNAYIPDGPWILTIDDFLSPAECEHLIEQGESLGYKRSKGLIGVKDGNEPIDIESETRTSFNTWCKETCSGHPETQKIAQRVNQLTSPIPEMNAEWWQLLKYETGQFYTTHTDYIEHHSEREPGVRILTVFFYLNTAEGGGTNFPQVQNLTVQPVQGRAVLWPSVLDEMPGERDDRTVHQALPAVTTKYGMNVWLHQRDYKTPYANACDN